MQLFRNLGAVAVAGVAGVALLKLALALVVPLLGMLLGLAALAFKVGLFVVAGFLAYRMFQAIRRRNETGV